MAEMNGEGPSPEVEARRLGWKPEAEFRGDKALWVDAETFMERGRTVMPILQANNKVLTSQLAEAVATMTNLKATVQEQAESLKALTEFQAAEVKRQVKAQVETIRTQLVQARKDGDADSEATLEGMLDEAKDRLKTVSAPAPAPAPAVKQQEAPEPWAAAFVAENESWYEKDKKKTAIFVAECQDLFAQGYRGRPLLDKAKEGMDAFFAEPGNRPDKSESGSRPGGGGGGGGGPKGHTYASLPADAKAIVESEAPKMVGPKKAFKTMDEWKKHYVSVYFES